MADAGRGQPYGHREPTDAGRVNTTDRWTDGRTDGRADGRTDGRTTPSAAVTAVTATAIATDTATAAVTVVTATVTAVVKVVVTFSTTAAVTAPRQPAVPRPAHSRMSFCSWTLAQQVIYRELITNRFPFQLLPPHRLVNCETRFLRCGYCTNIPCKTLANSEMMQR